MANSSDPDQILHHVASDLSTHCLLRPLIALGFNDASTLVGSFCVVSQRKGEKREEIVEKMKERDREERK